MAHKHGARTAAGLFALGIALTGAGPLAVAAADSGQNNSGQNNSGPILSGNRASSTTGPAQGGAIAFDGSAFGDNGSIFRGNRATSGRHTGSAYGGALFLQSDSQLVGSLVAGNRAHAADGYGGGVALPSGPDALTQVQAGIHRRNRATTAGDDLWWPATAESRLKG